MRLRFFTVSPLGRNALARILASLVRDEYSEKAGWGFIDVRGSRDELSGTFVERFETDIEIWQPLDEPRKERRISYLQTHFRLGVEMPQLELHDAPRSVTPLLTQLTAYCEEATAFQSLSFDLEVFIRAFRKSARSLSVTAATLREISLSTGVYARVSLSGTEEVRPFLQTAALGRRLELDKVSISGTLGGGAFQMEISSDGRVQLISGYFDQVRNSVIECLNKLSRR